MLLQKILWNLLSSLIQILQFFLLPLTAVAQLPDELKILLLRAELLPSDYKSPYFCLMLDDDQVCGLLGNGNSHKVSQHSAHTRNP